MRNPFPLVADERITIAPIDGQSTGATIYDWDRPYRIAPGQRTVGISHSAGTFYSDVAGDYDFQPGQSYVARCRTPSFRTVQRWIEEQATGRVLGETQTQGVYIRSYGPVPAVIGK